MRRINRWSKWVMSGAIVATCSAGMFAGSASAEPVALSPKGKYVPAKEAFKTRQEENIWKRMFRKTDELLRPPFMEAPEDTVKGLASKIRYEELDVKNRIAAVEYLGKVDCVAYPEAQAMLIEMLHNDKWEEVRYAAAMALRNMLSGCCSEQEKVTTDRDKEGRYDACQGCCNKDVLNALAKTAYEYNDKGCCFEPSQRVREMAVEAIKSCCIPCNYGPYMVPAEEADIPEKPPEDPETKEPDKEETPKLKGEEKPEGGEEKPPATKKTPDDADKPADTDKPTKEAFLVPIPLTAAPIEELIQNPVTTTPAPLDPVVEAAAYPVVDALKGYCVVALKARMFVKARPEFYSIHKGIRYHFWSEAAKAEFDRLPDSYAVQFNGADPVELSKGNLVQGQFLRDYEDNFYLFSSKENWDVFKGNPTAFAPQQILTPAEEIVRVGAMGRKADSSRAPAFATHQSSR